MIYADTDFFLALRKKSDWLKGPARRLLIQHKGEIWTSPITLIELLLVASEFDLDPERLIMNVTEIAELREGNRNIFLLAAGHVKERKVGVFDALHAAFCGPDGPIISSDKVFDRLGLERIPLKA